MEYEEFKREVISRIRDFLPEKYAGANISLERTVKTNDIVLDGLVIRKHEGGMASNLHLDTYYDDYLNGWSMENILRRIADVQVRALEREDSGIVLSEDDFTSGKVKDRITCRLVNIESNTLFLMDRPYTRMEDLAVVYSIQTGKKGDAGCFVPIKKSMLDIIGMDIKELHNSAIENMERLSPCVFHDLTGMAPGLVSGNELDKSVFLLTDENGMYGAATILNQKMMRTIAERLEGDFYILPSSVNEVIALPKDPCEDFRRLEKIVQETNAFEVSPDQILSDHVYEYHASERRLVRCDWAEERKMARDLEGGKNEKLSIKEQLAVPPVVSEKPVLKSGLER